MFPALSRRANSAGWNQRQSATPSSANFVLSAGGECGHGKLAVALSDLIDLEGEGILDFIYDVLELPVNNPESEFDMVIRTYLWI